MQPNLFDSLDRIQQQTEVPRFDVIFAPAGTGPQLRDEGMSKVLAKKAAQNYKGTLEHALLSFKVGDTFTVEQLTGIVGRPPEGVHFNSVGAIIAGMAKRGLIEKTGHTKHAQRPIMHATELAEWRLVKFPEREAV